MKNLHQSPLFVAVAGAFIGALAVAFISPLATVYLSKPAKSIRADYCTADPMKAYLIDADGRAWDVSDQMESYPISHVLTVSNDGTETITDQELNLSFTPVEWDDAIRAKKDIDVTKFELLELTVMLESAYAEHELDMDLRRPAHRIVLKNFNPGDQIAVVVESPYQLQAGVSAKGPGLTVSEDFTSGCTARSYGGYVAFREFSARCKPVEFPDLGLSCGYRQEIKKPKDMAEGPFKLEWRSR